MKSLHSYADKMRNCGNFLCLIPLALMIVLTMTGGAGAQQVIRFDAPHSGTIPGSGSEATGINLEGVITGNVTDNGYNTHGFVRASDGKITNFDAPLADPYVGCTCPTAINDLGVIAGTSIDTNSVGHGFFRSPDGQFTTFDVAEEGTAYGQGLSLLGFNDFGVSTGIYADVNGVYHGFVRSPDGRITTFDVAGAAASSTSPGNINNFGVIAGTFSDMNGVSHGFVRQADGQITEFDAPGGLGGSIGTYSAFINDFGTIAGSYYDANTNVEYGFLRWPNGQYDQFAAPRAGTVPFAGTDLHAINLEGTTTGFIFNHSVNSGGQISQVSHAFVRAANGAAATLNVTGQIDVANPDWFGSGGRAINAEGVVAGGLHDANSVGHAFLRIP